MKKYINLLPPENQKQIRLARINTQILSFGIWVFISLLVFAATLFTTLLFLQGHLQASSEEVAQKTKALAEVKEASVRNEVEEYNNNLNNFEILQSANQAWSRVLIETAANLPPDMTIDTLTISRQDRKVELLGHARSRNSVLQFRRSLLNSSMVSGINFPLANLEKPADLKWKYRFYVAPEFFK